MRSREEVIKGVIHHKLMIKNMIELNHDECFDCPYRPEGKTFCRTLNDLYDDVLKLIKEKEPAKAVINGDDTWECESCGAVVGWDELGFGGIEKVQYKFCPECGKPLMWE